MAYETIIAEKEGNIGIITLNRPPANAVNWALLEDLEKALDQFEGDKEVRALIITGAGEKGFSAGFDVRRQQGQKRLETRGGRYGLELKDIPSLWSPRSMVMP